MKIVHVATAAKGGASAHRPGGIAFTYLLEGTEDSPENFSLMLVHVKDEYRAPRHRHNFDQVRIMLNGAFGFDRGQRQEAGSVGYFTEGLYYTQAGVGESTTLLLQIGGASGNGYMSNGQLRAGVVSLQQRGAFHEGVYTRTDAHGHTRNQDSYEAAWEHTFSRDISYPMPRYDGPVLIAPEAFAWRPDATQAGVSCKALGTFHERGLAISYWKIAPDTHARLVAGAQRSAWVVLAGQARLSEPNETVTLHSAIMLNAGEPIALRTASSDLLLVRFDFPCFD